MYAKIFKPLKLYVENKVRTNNAHFTRTETKKCLYIFILKFTRKIMCSNAKSHAKVKFKVTNEKRAAQKKLTNKTNERFLNAFTVRHIYSTFFFVCGYVF